jgi:hypothetical protein
MQNEYELYMQFETITCAAYSISIALVACFHFQQDNSTSLGNLWHPHIDENITNPLVKELSPMAWMHIFHQKHLRESPPLPRTATL